MKAATLFGILLMSIGISGTQNGCSEPKGATPDIAPELDSLYKVYLTGDAAQARTSLHDSVKLVSKAGLDPFPRAHTLFLVYARLYCLEFRVGDQNLAEAYLVRARYWYLRREELPVAVGVPAPEDGIPTIRAAIEVKKATPDWIVHFVDDWDKRRTGGKLANYVPTEMDERI